MKKGDLIYKNSGRSLAHRITQNGLDIGRTNAKDFTNVPPLMSTEGKKLAANSAPRNAYEVVGVDDRQRMSLSDIEPEMWRRFKPGDSTPWDDPEEGDPDEKLFAVNADESEEESEEFDDEEEESETEENRQLARTGGAFDRARLFRAINRLAKREKRRGTSHDGRSYARDNRSYTTASGYLGGVQEWNAAYQRGEVC